jgi:hypothetical protein
VSKQLQIQEKTSQMKLCDQHREGLSGDGECYQCKIQELHELIIQIQVDRNLGNHVINDQRNQIKMLTEEIKQLKQLQKSS